MQSSQTDKTALIPRYGYALVFALGGFVVCIPTGIVLWYFCNITGWGDGATGDAIPNPTLTAVLWTLPLALYFILGIAAAISTRRIMRKALSLVAHISTLISLLLYLPILSSFPYAILGVLFVVFFFLSFWLRLLSLEPETCSE